MKNLIKTLIPISISVIIFIVLNSHFGKIPPLGNFFSPYSGFRQNNSNMDTIPEDMILPGLIEDVEIIWDKRKVPHIFANNTHDLYLAQGYIIARDRLWQMEIQTHNAAGRLSEVLGAQTLNIDRFNRRIGLAYGAENAYSEIQKDPEAGDAVEAFSEGVNAWINTLDESTYPVEYKILGYSPEEWTPYKSALLLKRMCWTLTGVHDEKAMNVTRQLIGEADVNRFFPFYPPNMDPIIPSETNWRFTPLKSPDNPGDNFNPRISMNYGQTEERYFVGSNNWAVSGERTKSGYPILCNDPHLGLTLPSIWYEIQLTAPGLNVYGVTLTGMPGVTIGFNSDIAWGVTNGGSDVLDWYKIKFNANNSEYSYDGDILRTQTRIEEIGIKGADSFLDTVLYTVHGPVVKLRNEEIFGNNIP
ncbi:MAG: penicillin acylase family protein, partial [bacterium]|nr:penicillin acylase family protein [bacterium]